MDEPKVIYYGNVFDASGYGHAARAYIHALDAAGVALSVVNLSNHERQVADDLVESLLKKPVKPDLHIFHGIPWGWGEHLSNLANTIAMTVWETDTMPSHWRRILNRVREVWLPCDFNLSVFGKQLRVPVFKLPHAIWHNGNGSSRVPLNTKLEIPGDVFVFYSIFEWQDRKNPLGLLESYLRTFKGDEGTLLFIKTNPNAASVALHDLERMRRKTESRANVEIRCETWKEAEIDALHERGNCYLSLHRGEGWGVPLFIAASRGKPVIATNYSGPTEFLDPNLHNLVRYRLTPVRQRYAFYDPSMHWAEPDTDHASELMRWVNDHRDLALEKAKTAAHRIRKSYSAKTVGAMARERLLEIRDGSKRNAIPIPSDPLRSSVGPIPAEWYDKDYFETGKKSNWTKGYQWSTFAELFRSTATFLCDSFIHAESFLDVGCAKGFLVQTLREKGKVAYGFDHSAWAVSHSLPGARPYLIQAGVDEIQFDRKFDMLVAFETFGHLTESQIRAFLLKARAWVSIGMLATIPSFDSAKELEEYKKNDRDSSHILLKPRLWWHDLFLSTGWKQDRLHQILQESCQQHQLPKSMKWNLYLYGTGG